MVNLLWNLLETSPEMHDYVEDLEAEKCFVMSEVNMTFPQAMKESPLSSAVPYSLRVLYRSWLIETYDIAEEDLPLKGTKIKPGIRLVVPHGRRWEEMLDEKNSRKPMKKKDKFEDEFLTMRALEATYTYVKATHELRQIFGDEKDLQLYANGATGVQGFSKMRNAGAKKKKKREKAVASGQNAPPSSLAEAFRGPDAVEWVHSADSEFDGLTDTGVVDHNYTDQMLIDAGVEPNPETGKITPIPLSIVLDHKYIDGILNRLKTCMALAGHSGNMQKGVQFDTTFSAAPNQHTACMMQAVMVDKQWDRLSFDIKQAYLHAELPPGKLIALHYPEGFRRYQKDDQGNNVLDERGKPIEHGKLTGARD